MGFHYPDGEEWIYRHFSLELRRARWWRLWGVRALVRPRSCVYCSASSRPVEGAIRLYSGGSSYVVSETTRSNFVYVPQGGSLFSGTIRENLLLGDESATEADLHKVLHLAIADFVLDLPKGLDTTIGERGLGLSEGQAQRIAIARALLRPGRILLLDEATSALDQATEAQFLKNLREHASDRLIIFITHHPDVAAACDRTLQL